MNEPLFNGDPARWRAYVRDAIIEPAIGRDLLALEAIGRPRSRDRCLRSPQGSRRRLFRCRSYRGNFKIREHSKPSPTI